MKKVGWVVVAVIVFSIIGVIAGHKKKHDAATTTGTITSAAVTDRDHARSYITTHGGDAYTVSAMVTNVLLAVGQVQTSPTTANIDALAQVAQSAHDRIDSIRDSFTYSDGGDLGDAEGLILLGANDLKNAMGAMVAYTGDPNPATLAHFTSQYQTAAGEWDQGARTVWRVAHRGKPPTV